MNDPKTAAPAAAKQTTPAALVSSANVPIIVTLGTTKRRDVAFVPGVKVKVTTNATDPTHITPDEFAEAMKLQAFRKHVDAGRIQAIAA